MVCNLKLNLFWSWKLHKVHKFSFQCQLFCRLNLKKLDFCRAKQRGQLPTQLRLKMKTGKQQKCIAPSSLFFTQSQALFFSLLARVKQFLLYTFNSFQAQKDCIESILEFLQFTPTTYVWKTVLLLQNITFVSSITHNKCNGVNFEFLIWFSKLLFFSLHLIISAFDEIHQSCSNSATNFGRCPRLLLCTCKVKQFLKTIFKKQLCRKNFIKIIVFFKLHAFSALHHYFYISVRFFSQIHPKTFLQGKSCTAVPYLKPVQAVFVFTIKKQIISNKII